MIRWAKRICLAGLAIPLLYLVVAVLAALVPAKTTEFAGPLDHEIRLIRGPIHYDFLLPATPRTRAMFGFAAEAGVPIDHPNVAWIVVGWGARDFYTTVGDYADLSARAIWHSVTGDDAVIRIDVLGTLDPDIPGLLRVPVRAAEFDALLATLSRDLTGEPAIDHPGFTATDAFFPAPGPFHVFRTCNVWVGEKLRQSGVEVGVWTPLTYTLTLSLRWFGRSA